MAFNNFFNNGLFSADSISPFIYGRVTKVILGPFLSNGERDPDYKSPSDIGRIRFITKNSTVMASLVESDSSIAKPLWTAFKQIPVENEYVYIIPGPSLNLLNDIGDTVIADEDSQVEPSFYYLPPYGLWETLNHNAFPSLTEYASYLNESIEAQRILEGTSLSPVSNSWEYPLGNNFIEKLNIRALRQFTGDLTIESRWGSSIRFGSSLATNVNENNWAIAPTDGDPITIIRNGQPTFIPGESWDPIVEDINQDPSSIYLTSGQRIDIADIRQNFSLDSLSFKFKPETTVVKTLTKVLNSNDNLSPKFVDDTTNSNGPYNV